MAIKTFSIANFSQTSSWTVAQYPIGHPNEYGRYLESGPSTSTLNKSVTFSGIPVGSTINSAVLTATVGGTAYTTRTLDGAFFSGSRNVKAKVTPGGSASFEFKFQGSGSTASVGTITSSLQYSNIKITVDYTLPSSGLTLNKSTCPAGGVIRANIDAAASTYTHTLRFYFRSWYYEEFTLAAGITYKDFTIPKEWQGSIPADTSDSVTVTLKTFKGGVQTGTDSVKTFTMTLSSDAYPALGTVTAALDLNGLPATFTKHIQGKTKVLVTLADETLAYGSPISTRTVTINGVTVNASGDPVTALCGPVAIAGETQINAVIKDGRGRTGSNSTTINVEPYSSPSLTGIQIYRSDVSGVESSTGTYILSKATGEFSSIAGENAVALQARFAVKGGAYGAWADMTGLTAEKAALLGGALALNLSYTVQIKAADTVGEEYIFTAEVPTEEVAFNIRVPGDGAAFGKYADKADCLDIAWSKMLLSNSPVCGIEVGQLYIHTNPTSPADKFPGTSWDQIPEGTFPMAGGATFVPGEASGEGGSATHTHGLGGGYAMLSNAGKYQSKIGVNYNSNYQIANFSSTNTNSTATAGAQLGGMTDSGDSRPPFRAYYMWERTA